MSRLLTILALTLLLPALGHALPRPGVWRPATGEVGRDAIAALTTGGDGALYAAGSGKLHRRDAEGRWQPLGLYAPGLRWDEGQYIEAVGPFPQVWLRKVSEDAMRSFEAVAGQVFESGHVSEDVARQILRNYVAEIDGPADSPYRVVRLLPAADGVWLATGAGLFRADAGGLRGPVGSFTGIRDLAIVQDTLWIATDRALWSLASDGIPVRRRIGGVETLATTAEGLAYLADETLWTWDVEGEPVRRSTPTGIPNAVTVQASTLWAATSLALYRYEANSWLLCPPIADAATRLVPLDDGVIFIGERQLYFMDPTCKIRLPQDRPWPGDMRMVDAAAAGDGVVWLATSQGLYHLVAHSQAAVDASRSAAFKRALSRLPSLDWMVRATLRYQGLDRASRSYGWRPALRGLLPTLTTSVTHQWTRYALRDADTRRLLAVEVVPPKPDWRITAMWDVSFDIFGSLFDVERSSAMPDQAAATQDEPLVDEVDVDLAETTPGFDTAADDAAFMLLAVERRQANMDRWALIKKLQQLYRERVRLMHHLWVELDPNGLHLKDALRLREIDAAFDALTGGEFGRLVRSTEGERLQ
jgi:hypothetical protein